MPNSIFFKCDFQWVEISPQKIFPPFLYIFRSACLHLMSHNFIFIEQHPVLDAADEDTVQLKWIKAHTGHWGNEKADELAKAGTVSSNLVCSLVPLNHIKNMINDKVNSLTHKRWNTNRHAHTVLILGNHHKKTQNSY